MENSIENRLFELIDVKDLSKQQFAEIVGISPSMLSHFKNGTHKVTLETQEKICQKFPDVRPEWLRYGTGQMFRQISNSHSGNLFGFVDDNTSYTNIYTEKNNVKSNVILDENKNFPPKNENSVPEQPKIVEVEKVIEKIVEVPVDKKISKIIVMYNNGTFEEIFSNTILP